MPSLRVLALGRATSALACGGFCFATAFAQSGRKQFPILVILENRFPPIPAIHQVIDRPRIFDSQLAWHAPTLPVTNPVSMFRTDPFMCQCLGPTPLRPLYDPFTTPLLYPFTMSGRRSITNS